MKNLYDSITEHFPEFDFEKRDFVWADFFTAGDFAQFITQKIRENEPIEKYLHFIEDLLFEAGDDENKKNLVQSGIFESLQNIHLLNHKFRQKKIIVFLVINLFLFRIFRKKFSNSVISSLLRFWISAQITRLIIIIRLAFSFRIKIPNLRKSVILIEDFVGKLS